MGVVLALLAAAAWGTGDYSGGLAMRRLQQWQVLLLSAGSGAVALAVCVALTGERAAPGPWILWALVAGAGVALGVTTLYASIARGDVTTVAPTAAVVTAAVPVAYGVVAHGMPSAATLLGFLTAGVGIWLVAQSGGGAHGNARAARDGVVAGCGFGSFLVLIGFASAGGVYLPVLVGRAGVVLGALVLMRRAGQPVPPVRGHGAALLAGVLDATGNALYVVAQQHARLDVAAVLASLYPVATVALAWWRDGERLSRLQWVGAALCLAAVILIPR